MWANLHWLTQAQEGAGLEVEQPGLKSAPKKTASFTCYTMVPCLTVLSFKTVLILFSTLQSARVQALFSVGKSISS